MATLDTIYTALTEKCVETVYPQGTANPSIVYVDVTIRPGYPDPNRLDVLLQNGLANISIYQLSGMQRNVSRYAQNYINISKNIPTLTLTVDLSVSTVTVNGTVTAGENAIINVNGIGYAYTVLQTDTLNTIASELSNLISGSSVLNNVITISDAYILTSRVGTSGKVIQELKRQQSIFQIDIKCALISQRRIITKSLENAFAQIFYLSLEDDIDARIVWKETDYYDQFQKVAFYQSCLKYQIEYATTREIDSKELNILNQDLTLYQGQLP